MKTLALMLLVVIWLAVVIACFLIFTTTKFAQRKMKRAIIVRLHDVGRSILTALSAISGLIFLVLLIVIAFQ